MTQTGASNYGNDTMFTFGPLDTTEQKLRACTETYGVTPTQADDQRKAYKYSRADLQRSTRILWVGGEFDGTIAYAAREPGVNLPLLNPDINVSRFLSVPEGAHCEDHGYPSDNDKPSVKRAREQVVEVIRGWLA
jgi:hypothetical protein